MSLKQLGKTKHDARLQTSGYTVNNICIYILCIGVGVYIVNDVAAAIVIVVMVVVVFAVGIVVAFAVIIVVVVIIIFIVAVVVVIVVVVFIFVVTFVVVIINVVVKIVVVVIVFAVIIITAAVVVNFYTPLPLGIIMRPNALYAATVLRTYVCVCVYVRACHSSLSSCRDHSRLLVRQQPPSVHTTMRAITKLSATL